MAATPSPVARASAATPTVWRLVAGGALVGGALAGGLAARGRLGRVTLGLGAAATAAYALPIALAGRRPPIPPGAAPLDPSAPPPTFSIVVAARDEAKVVAPLVRDVAEQHYRESDGTPRFELIVIDDRSIDGTAEAAMEAAEQAGIAAVTRIVMRSGRELADGKGAALTAAQPSICSGDVVVVLDADARIGPSFLSRLAAYVAAGADAVTCRRRVFGAASGVLAQVQADEQTVDGEIQRGRWALGGCSEFRGNGIVVRRELLEAVGGWRAEALTEDLDLSSRVAAMAGVTVAWAIDVEVWEEPVGEWRSLWRQRVRWAEGALRRVVEHGPAVLRSSRLPPGAKLDFGVYGVQLLVPGLVLGAAAGGLSRGRPGVGLGLVGSYLLGGAVLAFDALRWERDGEGRPLTSDERARRSVQVAAFGGIWLLAVPAALWRLATRRGPVSYDKMAHVGHAIQGGDAGHVRASGQDLSSTLGPTPLP